MGQRLSCKHGLNNKSDDYWLANVPILLDKASAQAIIMYQRISFGGVISDRGLRMSVFSEYAYWGNSALIRLIEVTAIILSSLSPQRSRLCKLPPSTAVL